MLHYLHILAIFSLLHFTSSSSIMKLLALVAVFVVFLVAVEAKPSGWWGGHGAVAPPVAVVGPAGTISVGASSAGVVVPGAHGVWGPGLWGGVWGGPWGHGLW